MAHSLHGQPRLHLLGQVLAVLPLLLLAPLMPARAQDQRWLTQFGSTAADRAEAAASRPVGGLFIAGSTHGNLAGPSAGLSDVFLAAFDEHGTQVWIEQFGTPVADAALALIEDGAGGTFIAGFTAGNLGGPGAGETDAFIARYDATGARLWIRQFGTQGHDRATTLRLDGHGGILVGGLTGGDLGAPNSGGNDAFVAHFDAAGGQQSISQFPTSHIYLWAGEPVLPDPAGGMFIAGQESFLDAVIAHYGSNGALIWSETVTPPYSSIRMIPRRMVPDGVGGLLISGTMLIGAPDPYARHWLARYDHAGQQLWLVTTSEQSSDAWAIAPDGHGGAFIAGSVSDGWAFTPSDVLLVQYDRDGRRLWRHRFGGLARDQASAAVSDGNSGFYFAGFTGNSLAGALVGGTDVLLGRYTGPLHPCYANCDASEIQPVLSVDDFTCFINRFAHGLTLPFPEQWGHYANCDQSLNPPVLNVDDFTCFINTWANGCW